MYLEKKKMYLGPSYYLWHITLFHNYITIKGVAALK